MGLVFRLWGCVFPITGVHPLVGDVGPQARVGSPVGKARAQQVQWQDLAYWWVSWVHRLWDCVCLVAGVCLLMSGNGPVATVGSLVGRVKDSGAGACLLDIELSPKVFSCRALEVLGLVLVH